VAQQIRDIIDVEHIKSQLKVASLDFGGCIRLIGSIIGVVASVHHRMRAAEREQVRIWMCQMSGGRGAHQGI
jgi:hypothetical protein